jgi:hypothetical protein
MRHRVTRLMALTATLALLAGCAGAAASPSPAPTPTSDPAATPEPPQGYLLRATTSQAVPPDSRFNWFAQVAITDRLEVVTVGATPAIFPGPLVPILFGHPISERGYAAIVEEARSMGLLSGKADFLPPDVAPGAALGRLELVADGRRFDLSGDPSRLVRCDGLRCIPEPGTPEAFAAFWQRLGDIPGWLGGEIGPQRPYTPPAYALLVVPPGPVDPNFPAQFVTWPLGDLSTAGKPTGAAPLPRCVTLRGDDLARAWGAIGSANQLTRFVDAGGGPAGGLGLVVRPMLGGEDVCKELFGLET